MACHLICTKTFSKPLFVFMSIGTLGTKFSEFLIKIQNILFMKMHLKILFAKWWPFCPGGWVNKKSGNGLVPNLLQSLSSSLMHICITIPLCNKQDARPMPILLSLSHSYVASKHCACSHFVMKDISKGKLLASLHTSRLYKLKSTSAFYFMRINASLYALNDIVLYEYGLCCQYIATR